MTQLQIQDHGAVRLLTLDRPAKKNAFSAVLAGELSEALRRAGEDESVGAVVLTGAGDAFSAGADLELFAQAQRPEDVAVVTNLHEALAICPRPVVAAVNGLAVGMGVTLLPYFDVVYAADTATFLTPFVRLGLVLEYGSSFTLPRLIGRQRASELILRAKPLDAATAERWGLVTRVFPREALLAETLRCAQDMAANGPRAVQASRKLLREGEERTLAEAIAAEWEVLRTCYGSEENRAAAQALLSRKK